MASATLWNDVWPLRHANFVVSQPFANMFAAAKVGRAEGNVSKKLSSLLTLSVTAPDLRCIPAWGVLKMCVSIRSTSGVENE
jgi:hypothetical protein